MAKIDHILEGIEDERHQRALRWFLDRKGQTIYASELGNYDDHKLRVVSQQGIHKPKVIDYALTIKVNTDSKYEEGEELNTYPDGGWLCRYHQFEGSRQNKRWEEAAPNVALRNCLNDQIPIVLLERVVQKPKPVEYFIHGLGLVTNYNSPYFMIEGVSNNGQLLTYKDLDTDSHYHLNDNYQPNEVDEREKQQRLIYIRQGQQKFRSRLLDAYSSRCCVTGCDVREVLEAAHISPYRGSVTHHIQNGLLLRADIHTLFDLGGCYISGDYKIIFSNTHRHSGTYKEYHEKKIALPHAASEYPSQAALYAQEEWAKTKFDYS